MKRQKKTGNPVLNLFSSVKLAVTLFIVLAVTSIVGTLIPQGENLQFYLEHYGPNFFSIIQSLSLYDTYHSWWYVSLLVLFSLNLLVCISRRLPYVLEFMRRDSLDVTEDRLLRIPLKASWTLNPGLDEEKKGTLLKTFLRLAGRRKRERILEDGSKVYLVEKGKWSYWGFYGLHFSLLIIFVGTIVGNIFGFGGNIMLTEGDSTDHIYAKGNTLIPLGFTVRCNKFEVKFYDNGAPKLFKSDLTIIDGGKEILRKEVLVNSPLTYKGVRFYQASYQAIPAVRMVLIPPNGKKRRFAFLAYRKIFVPGEDLELGVMQYLPNIHGVPAVRLWVADSKGDSQVIWLLKGRTEKFRLDNTIYKVVLDNIQNRYMTGLQVKKDPGVPLIYLGCLGLIFGIFIAFWVPHRRLWLLVKPDGEKTKVLIAGQSNKNKDGFKKEFQRLTKDIQAVIGGSKV